MAVRKFCNKCKGVTRHYKLTRGDFRCAPCQILRTDNSRKIRSDNSKLSLSKLCVYRLKIRVFESYGNKCACCGETDLFFLDLDHVNNDGYIERRKRGFCNYNNLRKAALNLEQFQILCCNCNNGKVRNNGKCPHGTKLVPLWFVVDLMWDQRRKCDKRFISRATVRCHSLKIQVFESYGNKCACCGETNLFFLELDHINNDGNFDRKRTGHLNNVFLNLKNAVKNPERFQLLCSNCNSGKARNGGICPHKTGGVPLWFIADML